MNNAQNRNNESGNVLFYILIAVVLIAALSYAVTRSNQGGGGAVSEEKAKLAASELIEFGNVVANAVAQLRLRGCPDTQLSFENDQVAGYTNGNAPSDDTCHLFKLPGGALNWSDVPADAAASATAVWTFNGEMDFENIGSNCTNNGCTEMVAIIPDVRTAVCEKVNDLLGMDTPATLPVDGSSSVVKFTGSYGYSNQVGDEVNSAKLAGFKTGCFTSTAAGYNVFYRILRAR